MKYSLTLLIALVLAPHVALNADDTPVPAVRAERPNIVYIIADDHAWTDFGFMGNERVHTPNLDRLAAQSARFTNGYVPSSVCRPSLVSLLTGLYPHQHGVHFNHGPPGSAGYNRMTSADAYVKTRQREFALIRKQKTLPGILQAGAGYRCLQTGKFWEGHWQNGGFTEGMTIFKAPLRSQTFGGIRKLASGEIVAHGNGDAGLQIGRVTMQPIYDFIDDCTASETPWFVWYAPYLPHQPHDSPKRFYDLARGRPGVKDHELPYFASIAQFDETVGQLIQYVGKQGQLKNTVFVFVSDNGWRPSLTPQRKRPEEFAHTARSKRAPFDDGLRTPILIRWDGVITPATWESPVSSIDLMPTLLAIADIAENQRPRLPGVDLLPVCRGQVKPDENRPIFGEIYPGDATSLSNPSADIAYRWIRQANLKLIEPHKQADGSGPWGGHLQSTALFDVKADPFEKHDLSSLAEHKQDVARLRTQLDRWWKPNTTTVGQPLQITDIETRVVAKAEGRWFGRATVERTAEGTLVLCYRGASKHTGSDGVIHMRFSSDGGQNWSEADHGLDGSPIAGFPISFDGDDAFEPYLYVAPDGRIILHIWRTTGRNHREGKGTWQTDSADGGQTWSKLRQVDFVGIENDDHCYATDDHTTIDGKIYTSLREYVGGEQRWRCRFIQSPDNGASWRVVGEQVNVPEHNSVEKGFEYVGGDRIVSVGSDGPGRRFVLQTRSDDRGLTWRQWKDALPQTGVWDRPRIWTLAHLKGEAEWWTDDTLIGVGNTTPKAGKKFPRANAVYLSTDRGESWKMLDGKPIDKFYPDGGYGDLEYDPETGWFVYLSYRGKGLHGSAEIVQYRFRLKESGEIREHKVTAEPIINQ